jgi:hypothetical protein
MESPPVVELPTSINAINIGLPLFETALRNQGFAVTGIDWRIPAAGVSELVAALVRLMGPKSATIERANADVVACIENGVPMLKAIDRAGAVVPRMGERSVLHSGPGIAWADMCDPLQRSIKAAIVAEGWAANTQIAGRMLAAGDVQLRPANEHSVVVPMATSIGPSAPVYVVENSRGSTVAYSSINQGSGAVQWFGVDSDVAIERLRFIRDAVGPVLAQAVASKGPIDVLELAAQGVSMGDDVHIRVLATTSLFLRDLLPHLVRSRHHAAPEVATFLNGNHLMFLNVAMAAAKSLVDSASSVEHSSIVTTMSRNGTTYGIRLSGAENKWFITQSPPIQDALYYPGFGPETSAPDIGDSAVLELIGLGGAAAANSPAVAGFLGGRMADAIAATREMRRICAAESSRFRLPILDNIGTPVGIDVRRVVELSITPAVNTGIVHAHAGIGQIGAGVARAPIQCFIDAMLDLDSRIR